MTKLTPRGIKVLGLELPKEVIQECNPAKQAIRQAASKKYQIWSTVAHHFLRPKWAIASAITDTRPPESLPTGDS
jgi:hypothetical protein